MHTTLYNTRKLNKLPFLEFLTYMTEKSSGLLHVRKSDEGYFNSKELIRNIIRRYMKEYPTLTDNQVYNEESNTLFKTESLLDKYRASQNEKGKKIIIEEFKQQLKVDLLNMIHAREIVAANEQAV